MQPYRRQQMNAHKINSPPLLSIAATDNLNGPHSASGGSYKKFVKPNTRFNMMSKNHDYDYKNIVVDLLALGIRKDGKEPNLVLRLFGLFRDLHIAIGEQPPIIEPPTSNESVYVPTFAPLPKIVLPCTMSVQCQVKYATTQVATFLYAMKRLMAVNIVYDHNLNAECELYIIKLRQMLAQFEMYKFVELKHKRGQFINESVRVHAEHLEKIMEQMNHQIREVNLRVIAADWFIAKKYGRNMGVTPKAATKPADLPYTIDNGVINEILQLCAPTANAKEAADGLDNAANGVTQINSANAELSRAAAVDNHAATTAVGATCLTKFNGHPAHNRQPVFYIG
ncbi:uncharacterized protein LOC131801524 [Musca domestica]|uniref:Uncharacterized protein LOC131801524 n=1 Tax=Musca domestica TaxID=7370 RepID=A0ABM3URV1_MUSDO|nr:uncharacterized protein LOC131801524 [Musca domestica]